MLVNTRRTDIAYVQDRVALRQHVAKTLDARAGAIVAEAVEVFPFAGLEGAPAAGLAAAILQLLIRAVRDGGIDARGPDVGELWQHALQKSLAVRPFFGLIYLIERAAADQLALDESFGATSEPWPAVSQVVRRASFDLLAALAEHMSHDPREGAVVDPLTTLHSKAVFMAALEKELQRAERFRQPIALILLDVDRLGEINARHGHGAGDRVLERIGIVVRNYFREHDWVARYAGDGFAVLLPATNADNARQLAERVRATVEQRLELHDHRTQEQVPVTVSVGVLIAESVDQSIRAEQLMQTAKDAVNRAKQAGRNRVERVDATVAQSVPRARDTMPKD